MLKISHDAFLSESGHFWHSHPTKGPEELQLMQKPHLHLICWGWSHGCNPDCGALVLSSCPSGWAWRCWRRCCPWSAEGSSHMWQSEVFQETQNDCRLKHNRRSHNEAFLRTLLQRFDHFSAQLQFETKFHFRFRHRRSFQ